MKKILFIVSLLILFQSCTTQVDEDKMISKEEALDLINKTQDKSTLEKEVWLSAGLDEETYNILWKAKTERPGSGELLDEKREGVYVSSGCNIPVFSSEHKYESGSGWPSFTDMLNKSNIILKNDYSLGFKRIEILSKCGEHLGHVFEDGPKDKGGLRYCINSKALKFIPKENLDK